MPILPYLRFSYWILNSQIVYFKVLPNKIARSSINFEKFQDYITYWGHRIFHMPFLYKNFHKLHHTYKQPTAFSVTAIHPVEFVIFQSIYISPMFIFTIHWGMHALLTGVSWLIDFVLLISSSYSAIFLCSSVYLLPWYHWPFGNNIQEGLVAALATWLYFPWQPSPVLPC